MLLSKRNQIHNNIQTNPDLFYVQINVYPIHPKSPNLSKPNFIMLSRNQTKQINNLLKLFQDECDGSEYLESTRKVQNSIRTYFENFEYFKY